MWVWLKKSSKRWDSPRRLVAVGAATMPKALRGMGRREKGYETGAVTFHRARQPVHGNPDGRI